MNKGFITIPILVITFLGITVVGGGGYAVYKVNQIQQESDTRVSELELKIEQIAPEEPVVEVVKEVFATTTTTTTASSENDIAAAVAIDILDTSDVELKKEVVIVEENVKLNENYNIVVIAAIDNRIDYQKEIIIYFDEMLQYMDNYLSRFIKTRDETAALGAGDNETIRAGLKYYDSTIEYIKVMKEYPIRYKALYQNDITYHSNLKNSLATEFLNSQQSMDQIKTVSDWTAIDKNFVYVNDQFDDFVEQMINDDREMQKAFSQRSNQPSSAYIPMPLPSSPSVRIPTFTDTTCSIWGDTLNCKTFTH